MTVKIAIDGPAGAGKSTVAKELAKLLNFTYVDTGAMYRALTYKILESGINLNDEERIRSIADNTNINLIDDKVLLDNKDITEEIRKPYISEKVSYISQISAVREILVKKQKLIASKVNVIMDGRDIATVVLPDAQFKFFLTASLEVRAKRRYKELKSKNICVNYEQILLDIQKRDKIDSERDISPLKITDDSIVIDTSELSIREVVDKIYNYVKSKMKVN